MFFSIWHIIYYIIYKDNNIIKYNDLMTDEKKVLKKRGRKPKNNKKW